MIIPFNIPYLAGKEKEYITDAVDNSETANYNSYINRCEILIKNKWGYKEIHLTTSCTSALEISAMLIDLKPGDEVIIPSYTFPSTANAFIRQGAKIICADSRIDNPGIDEDKIESLITENTKAIIPVHYAGVACDMDKIMNVAEKHDLFVIEDAAHGLDGYYKGHPLGSIGHIGCISFHRTKNLQCDEGGVLIINDKRFSDRVDDIIEKGTNRQKFIEGKTEHYEWIDIGSSFGMRELHAAYLFAQLEVSESIKEKRKHLWQTYYDMLLPLHKGGMLRLPYIPAYSDHNAHIFYLLLDNSEITQKLIFFMSERQIQVSKHYTPLNISEYWKKHKMPLTENPNSLIYYKCLLRFPLYNNLTLDQVEFVASAVIEFLYTKNMTKQDFIK